MRTALFYIIVILVGLILVVVSLNNKNSSMAIVAEVEPQKTAISFPKPVKIKKLYVSAGQHVKKGELLLEVERPDLMLDIERLENEVMQLEAEQAKVKEDYLAKQELESIRHKQKMALLNTKLMELSNSYQADSLFFREVTTWAGIDSTADDSQYSIVKKSLLQEKQLENEQYQKETYRQSALFKKETEFLKIKKARLYAELESHLAEQQSLKQYSSIDGTIGSVSVQLMELIPPYQTIISVYDENPNLIKAYMNEQATIPVEVGDVVRVESINRTYSIQGEIVEIGSRIVSYPSQMTSQAIPRDMWGKEIFVQIPPANKFLNGEKVYVYLKAK